MLSAIPREWRRSLEASASHPAGLHVKGVTGPSQERVSCRQARTLFIDAKFKEPLVSTRLCRSGVDPTNLKDIYSLPFKMTKETKLSIFQYKIIHNILPYGILLYKMRITDSPYCKHCHELETLDHMLLNCRSVRQFWHKGIDWWNLNNNDNYIVDKLAIMYGYNLGDTKSIVFVRRLEFNPPRFDLFVELVKEKINVQKAVNALRPRQRDLEGRQYVQNRLL